MTDDNNKSLKASDQIYDEKTLQDIETLRSWIKNCKRGGMVFFGGAGVSTESGIKDFRSADGLYNQKTKWPYSPETMISHSFFRSETAMFYDYYCECMLPEGAQPNQAHIKLAQLEKQGKLRAVITQNIDGLHQSAGSENVYELHGSVLRNYCTSCDHEFSLDELLLARKISEDGIPRCGCKGIIKPDVVLYEESLDSDVLQAAIHAVSCCDLLLVAGTSLAVYPAAGLVDCFTGEHLVIVNRDPTPYDHSADLCISANIGEVMDF